MSDAFHIRVDAGGRYLPGLFLLSAATLAFEINLTRIFSVAQFYHFAFMVVSIALLGFGASGTALTIFPFLQKLSRPKLAGWCLGSGAAMLVAYILTNQLPFDSFSIAWDRRQVWILVMHYLALAAPFFFSGLVTGLLLSTYTEAAGRIYAANLLGSAAGCVLALAAPAVLGAEGMVGFCAGVAGAAGLAIQLCSRRIGDRRLVQDWLFLALLAALILIAAVDAGLRVAGRPGLAFLRLHLSPYKSISYALQSPGSKITFQRWNSFSRVDVVDSPAIHSVPGLSYRYLQPLPRQAGLFVDGDDLNPLFSSQADLPFTGHLLTSASYLLRPKARVLILEPRGGLDVLAALEMGAERVVAVEMNPLIVAAAGDVYRDARVQVVIDTGRSYLRRSGDAFDIVQISLVSTYHPVRSGAYSLGEDYRYTVEAFEEAFSRLKPDGILSTARWLQDPPSESLRLFATAVTSLERQGLDPGPRVIALRSYNLALILAKKTPFTLAEQASIRAFASSRAFDLDYAPGLQPEEANRYNVLPEPVYFETYQKLMKIHPRDDFYSGYPYDVRPPTDDRPFFGHYFKWSQAGEVLAELGRTWQPFGGAGYFVILALLAISLLLALLLVFLPVVYARWRRRPSFGVPGTRMDRPASVLAYFALLGLAYLLVEIPLIQRFILYLGQPAYAMTAVLFSLLFFSGLGSQLSRKISPTLALAALCVTLLISTVSLPWLLRSTLGLPFWMRLALAIACLAPVGFLMGVPFPSGIRCLADARAGSSFVGWVWAANGAASVVAAVLAALLALSFGFSRVFLTGTVCYAGALLIAMEWEWGSRPRSLLR